MYRLFNANIERESSYSSWKIGKLTPIFKKDDTTEIGNYRPISLLSIPSKILESEVNDTLVHHVFKKHRLASDRRWAYRQENSTELPFVYLAETWRKAVDSGLIVAVAFVDFRKAFDSVSHQVLLEKLRANFGICDKALGWIARYLNGRRQYKVVNVYNSDTIYARIRRYTTGSSARPYIVLSVCQRSTVKCEIKLHLLIWWRNYHILHQSRLARSRDYQERDC